MLFQVKVVFQLVAPHYSFCLATQLQDALQYKSHFVQLRGQDLTASGCTRGFDTAPMVSGKRGELVWEENQAEVILPEKFISDRKQVEDQPKLSFINLAKMYLKLLYAVKEQCNIT